MNMINNVSSARKYYEQSHGKFTQEDAARYFKVSLGTYRNWEQGIGRLNGEVLCAIADKYECSTDFLLCRTDEPSPYPPVGQSATSNKDEIRLIKSFRQCSKRGQNAVIATVEAMADSGSAKNMDDRAASEALGA